MNAPIDDQIKAKAASSLLERMAEKTKLVRFFRYNAAAKHGVPIDAESDGIYIKPTEPKEKEPEPVQQPPSQNVVQIVKTADETGTGQQGRQPEQTQTSTQPGMSDRTKGILQTLAVLCGLGAAAWGGSQLGNTDEAPVKDNVKVTAPYYSPYQYLEDTGDHLP